MLRTRTFAQRPLRQRSTSPGARATSTQPANTSSTRWLAVPATTTTVTSACGTASALHTRARVATNAATATHRAQPCIDGNVASWLVSPPRPRDAEPYEPHQPAWFGPKLSLGWGWRINSWQGWLTTGVFVTPLAAASAHWGRAHPVPIVVGVVAYLVVVVLTGDPPGGPRTTKEPTSSP